MRKRRSLPYSLLRREIKNLNRAFSSKNELAYLALTAKPENHIRDRIAWQLQRTLWPRWLVAREYSYPNHHADIALIRRDSRAKIFVEFKQMYTFDSIKGVKGVRDPGRFARYIIRDINYHKRSEETYGVPSCNES